MNIVKWTLFSFLLISGVFFYSCANITNIPEGGLGELLKEKTTEKTSETKQETTTEKSVEKTTETSKEVSKEALSEVFLDRTQEKTVEVVKEQVQEKTVEVVKEQVQEKTVEVVKEILAEKIVETDASEEPSKEPVSEPVVEKIAELDASVEILPEKEPVVEKVTETTAEVVIEPTASSFATDVLPLIQKYGCANCHSSSSHSSKLDLANNAYSNLVNVKSSEVGTLDRVNPNDPSKSYFYEKLSKSSPTVGSQMPLGGNPLTTSELQIVQQWILDGAKP